MRVIEYYDNLINSIPSCQKECIVNPGFPILWFGNIDKYFQFPKEERAVSIGVNPSSRELSKGKGHSYKRFPGISYPPEHLAPDLYRKQLNGYFNHEHYDWFDRGQDSLTTHSYQKGNLIHIDCCSTVATKPSWSSLCATLRARLKEDNFPFFKEMLLALEPSTIYIASNRIEYQYVLDACNSVMGQRNVEYKEFKKYGE